jgi:hypothetical protein
VIEKNVHKVIIDAMSIGGLEVEAKFLAAVRVFGVSLSKILPYREE